MTYIEPADWTEHVSGFHIHCPLCDSQLILSKKIWRKKVDGSLTPSVAHPACGFHDYVALLPF